MDCSPLGSSVHEIFQARIPQWVAISFSRGSSQPRDHTCLSCIYHWASTEAHSETLPISQNNWWQATVNHTWPSRSGPRLHRAGFQTEPSHQKTVVLSKFKVDRHTFFVIMLLYIRKIKPVAIAEDGILGLSQMLNNGLCEGTKRGQKQCFWLKIAQRLFQNYRLSCSFKVFADNCKRHQVSV